jgi:tRNA-Thr(GGU) m(6)t(6)A37 methyltransferase TsaA
MKTFKGTWHSIGIIHTPYAQSDGTPIQPFKGLRTRGTVEVDPKHAEALKDIDGFERVWLLYWFHRSKSPKSLVKPFMDTTERGLFATRAPSRYNNIGMSPVRLLGVKGNILEIEDMDILDGTPLLDIKPYIVAFDSYPGVRQGWVDDVDTDSARGLADNRFSRD